MGWCTSIFAKFRSLGTYFGIACALPECCKTPEMNELASELSRKQKIIEKDSRSSENEPLKDHRWSGGFRLEIHQNRPFCVHSNTDLKLKTGPTKKVFTPICAIFFAWLEAAPGLQN